MSGLTLNSLLISVAAPTTAAVSGSHDAATENSAFGDLLGVLDRRDGGDPADASTTKATQAPPDATVRAAAAPGEVQSSRFVIALSASPAAARAAPQAAVASSAATTDASTIEAALSALGYEPGPTESAVTAPPATTVAGAKSSSATLAAATAPSFRTAASPAPIAPAIRSLDATAAPNARAVPVATGKSVTAAPPVATATPVATAPPVRAVAAAATDGVARTAGAEPLAAASVSSAAPSSAVASDATLSEPASADSSPSLSPAALFPGSAAAPAPKPSVFASPRNAVSPSPANRPAAPATITQAKKPSPTATDTPSLVIDTSYDASPPVEAIVPADASALSRDGRVGANLHVVAASQSRAAPTHMNAPTAASATVAAQAPATAGPPRAKAYIAPSTATIASARLKATQPEPNLSVAGNPSSIAKPSLATKPSPSSPPTASPVLSFAPSPPVANYPVAPTTVISGSRSSAAQSVPAADPSATSGAAGDAKSAVPSPSNVLAASSPPTGGTDRAAGSLGWDLSGAVPLHDLLRSDPTLGVKSIQPRTHLAVANAIPIRASAVERRVSAPVDPNAAPPSGAAVAAVAARSDSEGGRGHSAGAKTSPEAGAAAKVSTLAPPAVSSPVPTDAGSASLAPGAVSLARLPSFVADQVSGLTSPSVRASETAAAPTAPRTVKELEIKLEPAELGAVSLKLRLSGGKLSIVIGVSNPSTLAAIENERGAIVGRIGDSQLSPADLVIQPQVATPSRIENSDAADSSAGQSLADGQSNERRPSGGGSPSGREPPGEQGAPNRRDARDRMV